MAWTEKYVTAGAGGGGDGSSGSPWTLAEAASNLANGERANVQSDGAYTLTGNIDFADGTNPYTYKAVRGYNSTIGDLDTPAFNSDGTVDTTNFPDIDCSTYNFNPGSYNHVSCLDITGANTTAVFGNTSDDGWTVFLCRIQSTASGASADVVQGDNYCGLTLCDIIHNGATSSYCVDIDLYGSLVGCLLFNKSTNGSGCVFARPGMFADCVFAGDGNGIEYENNAAAVYTIHGCAFHGLDTALLADNAAQVSSLTKLFNNIAYDCAEWINNPYVTSNFSVLESNNALGSITTPRTNIGDSIIVGEITLTGDPFTDSANWDFTLNNTAGAGALCRAAGVRSYRDVGALQHQDAGGSGGGVAKLIGPGGLIG